MKKIAFLLFAVTLPMACTLELTEATVENENAHQPVLKEVVLTAASEGAQTKTYFNRSTGALTWTVSESAMAIFDGTAKQSFSHVETLEEGAKATFSGTADVSVATWTAVHPATHAALDGEDIIVTFPCFQTIRSGGGMLADVNTMAAQVTHDGSGNIDDFTMKNVGGLLKLTVAKAGIKTITVSSRGGEALTGKAKLTFDGSGNPVVTPVDTKYETFVTLCASDMASGIPTGDYFVNIFPVTMASGLIIDMENIDGTVASVKSSSTATVARSADLEFAGFDTVANWYEPEETTMTLNFKNVTWPFVETTSTGASDDNSTKWKGNTEKQLTYTQDNSILFYINCSNYCSANGGNGLRFGKGTGDYLLFPAIQGKNLIQVKVKYVATKTDQTKPAILTRGGNDVVIGGDAIGKVTSGAVGSETVETWDLTGTAHNMQYRYQLTFGGNDVTYIDQIDLTYASKKTNLVLDVNFWLNTGDNGSMNSSVFSPSLSDYATDGDHEDTYTFTQNANNYTFVLGNKHRMRANLQNRGLGMATNSYITLPAVSGYKLTAVSAVRGGSTAATDSEEMTASGRLCVCTSSSVDDVLADGTMIAAACTQSSPTSFTASLASTSANTSYYIVAPWGWQYIRNLRLVYTPVSPSPAPSSPASLLDGGEIEL